MTLAVPRDLQYSLLEFISHLNAENFDSLPQDFVNLGATPADKIDRIRESGITEGFSFVMKQLSQGGGPTKIRERLQAEFRSKYGDLDDGDLQGKARADLFKQMEEQLVSEGVDVNNISNVVDEMSKRNREIFKLPTYLLYVFRAFSVLEGIGLSIDDNYSILQECYPYLAKRLMTDNSPRSREALRNMLVSSDGLLATNKLIEFSDGFANYTASTVDSDRDGAGMRMAQNALTELILDSDGNLMQDILLETAANVTDALVREGFSRIKLSAPGQAAKNFLKAPKTAVNTFIPPGLRFLTLPLTLPYDLTKAIFNLAGKDDSDKASIDSVSNLWNFLKPKMQSQFEDLAASGVRQLLVPSSPISGPNGREENSTSIVNVNSRRSLRDRIEGSKLRERIPSTIKLSRKLSRTLLNRVANRIEKSIHRHDDGNNNHEKPTEIVPTFANKESDSSKDNNQKEDEIEQLLTSRIGSLSVATAKSLASALDDKQDKKDKVE